MNPNRQVIKPPDKGSFPLDHFHDCNREALDYSNCVQKHQMMPKRCRVFQKNYLECRMRHGLMDKTDLDSLGFGKELDWNSEEEEKKVMFDKIENLKQRAQARVNERYGKREETNGSEKSD